MKTRKNSPVIEKRACACGCGKTFSVNRRRAKRFFDAAHASRYHARELSGVPKKKHLRDTCGRGVASRYGGVEAV